ncbi:MAG: hypothetical protein IIC24_00285 [Chloroflexi bacterium]|nr:hypothetical protein [Chloroflexota bacterium]MCH8309057.1 hypothetical protein [Chloroflexota bacterium]
MASSLAGLLIMGVFFTGALMMFHTSLFGNVLISNAMKEAVDLSGDRARTAIEIPSSIGDGTCNLTINIANTGTTAISGFSKMDIIVQFVTGNNSPHKLTFAKGNSPANEGEWTVSAISGQFEPGILNPGEILTVKAKLALVEASSGVLTVGTPNGITDTRTFPSSGSAVSAPCV